MVYMFNKLAADVILGHDCEVLADLFGGNGRANDLVEWSRFRSCCGRGRIVGSGGLVGAVQWSSGVGQGGCEFVSFFLEFIYVRGVGWMLIDWEKTRGWRASTRWSRGDGGGQAHATQSVHGESPQGGSAACSCQHLACFLLHQFRSVALESLHLSSHMPVIRLSIPAFSMPLPVAID